MRPVWRSDGSKRIAMKRWIVWPVILLPTLFACAGEGPENRTESVRYTSYNGLVMTGYQGWFNTSGDGADLGWKHYKKDDRFEPGFCNIDLWPDMSEYEKSYVTPFRHADGTPARLFSSHDQSTVELHFRWMRQYGIDGAFMQRFVQSLKNPKLRRYCH